MKQYEFRVVSSGIMSIPNFIQIRPAVLELNHADRQTDMASPICVHFVYIVQRTHTTKLSENLVRTSKKNQHFSVTKMSWLTKPINTKFRATDS
jgi:hypothetical protein